MKTLKKLLLALLLGSLSLACKKEKEKQNQPTQTGANTIYAKINGTPWQKKTCWSCIGGGSGLIVSYDNRTNFSVKGQNNDQKISLSIFLRSLSAIGIYELSSSDLNSADLINTTSSDNRLTTTKISKGIVTITKLDLVNKIISGTFEFIAQVENNPSNTIKVTDGWFDITYR